MGAVLLTPVTYGYYYDGGHIAVQWDDDPAEYAELWVSDSGGLDITLESFTVGGNETAYPQYVEIPFGPAAGAGNYEVYFDTNWVGGVTPVPVVVSLSDPPPQPTPYPGYIELPNKAIKPGTIVPVHFYAPWSCTAGELSWFAQLHFGIPNGCNGAPRGQWFTDAEGTEPLTEVDSAVGVTFSNLTLTVLYWRSPTAAAWLADAQSFPGNVLVYAESLDQPVGQDNVPYYLVFQTIPDQVRMTLPKYQAAHLPLIF